MIPQHRRIWRFHGGLHLDEHKSVSLSHPLRQASLPPLLYLPLQQHIGAGAEPMVQPGDVVGKGQLIARATEYVSANLHAPTSGRIVEIAEHVVAHPSGLKDRCVVLEPDGREQWAELPAPLANFAELPVEAIRERIRWAGIVGLGGAAFPTSVKLNPGLHRRIETLVVNGAECEPYITCDDMLMRKHAEGIVQGIAILRHCLGFGECLIGIEDNKPEAIAAMRAAVTAAALPDTEVVEVPTRYPTGGERQLIYILTGREVPSSGLPAQIGVLCQNVGTVFAVAEAVLQGRPLIRRLVTVTGAGVTQPGNFEVSLGTPAAHLIAEAGGYSTDIHRLILGGPMMGFALHSDAAPVTKGANCLLAATLQECPEPAPAVACIRCGRCAEVCPAQLLPQQLYWYARAKNLDQVQDHHLFDCIECGCCSYVCPSHIPLVQYYRHAKMAVWSQEKEREAAEHARQRHAARTARQERLEAERKAKLRKKKEALESGGAAAADDDPKKAAIAAAMQRVAAKKAQQQAEQTD